MTPRRLAELLFRNRRLVRRTPAAYGNRPLIVSPDAALRWLRADPWHDESALLMAVDLLARPGAVIWDLGANVGAFAICAAQATRAKVVMLDADAFMADCLRETMRRNPDLDLEVLCCAIGADEGVARFAIAGRGRSTNGLIDGKISTQHGESREILLVPTITADRLLDFFEPPAVVKVDLEGGEAMFVAGAERLLSVVRPLVYIEIHRDNRPAVLAAFARHGYEVRQNIGQGWIPVSDDPPSEDFFAAPRERATALFG